MKRLILALLALLLCTASFSQGKKATYKVAQRDTCDLFMDVYEPVTIPGDTLDRPTILFVFGGGFIMGRRDDPWVMPWFKLLNENGYRVVSVDYRLGLKGIRMRFDLFHLIQSANYTKTAVDMGVEDVFASVRCRGDDLPLLRTGSLQPDRPRGHPAGRLPFCRRDVLRGRHHVRYRETGLSAHSLPAAAHPWHPGRRRRLQQDGIRPLGHVRQQLPRRKGPATRRIYLPDLPLQGPQPRHGRQHAGQLAGRETLPGSVRDGRRSGSRSPWTISIDYSGRTASTVSTAFTLSPSFTWISASRGRNRSMREPNLMTPHWSPRFSMLPGSE